MRRFSLLPVTLFVALAAVSLWAFSRFEKPTTVATVDLERLYSGLDEHKAGENAGPDPVAQDFGRLQQP